MGAIIAVGGFSMVSLVASVGLVRPLRSVDLTFSAQPANASRALQELLVGRVIVLQIREEQSASPTRQPGNASP